MKPTVGRIINVYFRDDYAPGKGVFEGQPWPAIITHVWDDHCVNAWVFPKDGGHEQASKTGGISSINYVGHEEATLVWWEWPRREPTQADKDLARLNSTHMKMG
jgi:hypothetical protein